MFESPLFGSAVKRNHPLVNILLVFLGAFVLISAIHIRAAGVRAETDRAKTDREINSRPRLDNGQAETDRSETNQENNSGLMLVDGQTEPDGGDTDEVINRELQAAVIDSITRALNEVYVFPDVAGKMEKHIRRRFDRNAYEGTTHGEFAVMLNMDLFEISRDKHLRIKHAPDEAGHPAWKDTLTEEEEKQMFAQMAYNNFGFFRVERLPGNIGYIDLRGFDDAQWAGGTAVAAMNFLAHCNAVIIDLRRNRGGSPGMIQLISSYFFEEPVLLSSYYIRAGERTKQFWSYAHVEGPRLKDVDLYILTSPLTFSAAEEFAYNMKNLNRATIIGETTGGGAHPVRLRHFQGLGFVMSLPYGRAVNPVTGTNWEGTGIEPHIEVPWKEALEVARLEAMKELLKGEDDDKIKQILAWDVETLEAELSPVSIASGILRKFAGVYGSRIVIYEDGELFYQREGRSRYRMIPMAEDLFRFEEIGDFRLKVIKGGDGNPTALLGVYMNGQTDISPKSAE